MDDRTCWFCIVLVVSMSGVVLAQPRGGAGGIGAASGGFGGPGVGVSGGGAPAIGESFGAISRVNSWAASAAPQSADPNAQQSYTARFAPAYGKSVTASFSGRRPPSAPLPSTVPDTRARGSLSPRDDLYLGLTHSVLGNPHGDSRRPRKRVGQTSVGTQLGPDAKRRQPVEPTPSSNVPPPSIPRPDQGARRDYDRHRQSINVHSSRLPYSTTAVRKR
jgi:hypothetical protein